MSIFQQRASLMLAHYCQHNSTNIVHIIIYIYNYLYIYIHKYTCKCHQGLSSLSGIGDSAQDLWLILVPNLEHSLSIVLRPETFETDSLLASSCYNSATMES